jgi:hypothetical protein
MFKALCKFRQQTLNVKADTFHAQRLFDLPVQARPDEVGEV